MDSGLYDAMMLPIGRRSPVEGCDFAGLDIYILCAVAAEFVDEIFAAEAVSFRARYARPECQLTSYVGSRRCRG